MSKLTVTETTVPVLLKGLRCGEWLVPKFQRDFVWSNSATISLINSIIDAKPVGMVTLWEQEDQSDLELEHVSIPDSIDGRTQERYYGDPTARTGRYYAVLDGRQRSTALALAFGGLRAQSGTYRNSVRFYLDVCAKDDNERVVSFRASEVQRKNLIAPSSCIAQGLFPLEVSDPDKIYTTWMDYLQEIGNAKNYPDQKLPPEEEIARRNTVLRKAFSGIINTKIAVYIVPKEYALSEICEIFETLNTTGTKVSTVDLIHSWLYSDTKDRPNGPILLRDEIDILGEQDGAVGWADSKDRPELIAQIVAACHVALDKKPAPRSMGSAKPSSITSVKSADLLAIPSAFWETVIENNIQFAKFLGDFQTGTTGGIFSMNDCPYPASASIYVALRWYLEFDKPSSSNWGLQHLDPLFRAFFWRNVFLTRYDQGFLSQIGADILDMKEFLASVKPNTQLDDWKVSANAWLDRLFSSKGQLSEESIANIVSDGKNSGALKKGSILLFTARATDDPVDRRLSIKDANSELELHHIFPKDWCRNNATGKLAKFLNPELADRDWINSAANLLPMHRVTNNKWRKRNPGQFIEENSLNYNDNQDLWLRYFVTEQAFNFLKLGADGMEEFWKLRRDAIARAIFQRTLV
jgi:hypothetical protein